jgi:bisphosphoglycerate-dependent phosphoglycerate mutase
MALMYLTTLSEQNSNDIDAQKWLISRVCNRAQFLGTVTLTTMGSTYDELSTLITKLCQLYSATGGMFWALNDMLDEKIKEAEAQYGEEQLESARADWKARPTQLDKEDWDIDERRGEELRKKPLRSFFKPRGY